MISAGCMTRTEKVPMCPISPKLSIETTTDGYAVSREDMRDLLHYVTDLEYAADCRRH
ncbi:MAG: hypothetical protein ACJAZ5_000135 [Alloalcanivorax venustensis]